MVHRTQPSRQLPARFEILPPDDAGRAVAGDELRVHEEYADPVPSAEDVTPQHIVCADGTKRSIRRSPFLAAHNYAKAAAVGDGISTNFPRELQELADAHKDALGRMDIVAVADARRKLGIYAKHRPMGEDERKELEKARRERRIERGEVRPS